MPGSPRKQPGSGTTPIPFTRVLPGSGPRTLPVHQGSTNILSAYVRLRLFCSREERTAAAHVQLPEPRLSRGETGASLLPP